MPNLAGGVVFSGGALAGGTVYELGIPAIVSVTPTSTGAVVAYTGLVTHYRVDGGAAVAVSSSPFTITGLTPNTAPHTVELSGDGGATWPDSDTFGTLNPGSGGGTATIDVQATVQAIGVHAATASVNVTAAAPPTGTVSASVAATGAHAAVASISAAARAAAVSVAAAGAHAGLVSASAQVRNAVLATINATGAHAATASVSAGVADAPAPAPAPSTVGTVARVTRWPDKDPRESFTVSFTFPSPPTDVVMTIDVYSPYGESDPNPELIFAGTYQVSGSMVLQAIARDAGVNLVDYYIDCVATVAGERLVASACLPVRIK